jgi:cytochrome P450
MSSLSRLPGPKGSLLSGNLGEIRKDILAFLTRCTREYGDVCGFRIAWIRCCQIGDPMLIEQVLVRENDKVRKPFDIRAMKAVLGNGLLTNEGESWRHQRRLIQPAFHHDRVGKYAGIMTRRAEQMASRWQNGQSRDFHADMMELTLQIVAEALFGFDVSRQAKGIAEALGAYMDWFEDMIAGGLPLPLWVPTPKNLRVRRQIRAMHALVDDLLRVRRAKAAEGDDLLSWMMRAVDDDGMRMDDQQLRDEVVTLLMAGHETTAIALSWTIYLLGRNPDVEAKLVAELSAVLGGRAPEAQDFSRLGYTRQVVEESLRLYPPAWAIAREVVEPFELGGYELARGTQIFMSQWVTQRDARFFPEPERFIPERWSSEHEREIPKYAHFPFGGGPRYCVGSTFATMEAVMLLAVFLQRFHFEIDESHPIELQPAVTLRPRYGVHVVPRRR